MPLVPRDGMKLVEEAKMFRELGYNQAISECVSKNLLSANQMVQICIENKHLNEKILELRSKLEQVTRERDAVVSDITCIMRVGGRNINTCDYCTREDCYDRGGDSLCRPVWRGERENIT